MAAATDRGTWINFVAAGYHDDAPGHACGYCNLEKDAAAEASGGKEDTGTPTRKTRGPLRRSRLLQVPRTGKECRRFFCVPCKEGSLCEKECQAEDSPHFQHTLLQVFKTTYESTVRQADVSIFLDTSAVMEYFSNHHVVHYVKTRKLSTTTSIYCHGCKKPVANAKLSPYKERNLDSAKVCSIQCLLLYLQPTVNYRNGHYRKQMEPRRSPLA